MIPHDDHFRQFIGNLELATSRYEGENNLAAQQAMVERLVKLEKDFRKTLIRHRWGKFAYRKFVEYVMGERRNILMARPYFRERNEVFQNEISDVFRASWDSAARVLAREPRALYRYHINFPFIKFVMDNFKWSKGSAITALYTSIQKQRDELAERNMPLAISEARLFYGKTPKSHLAFMDCIQHSADGLMSAIDKYCLPYSSNYRAVIIGRIRGNLIEAYSETSLHFYPGDKRRLYRARKAMARMDDPHDYDELARILNREEPESHITSGELANLIGASSVVNEGMLYDPTNEDSDEASDAITNHSAGEEARPDVALEEAEVRHRVASSIQSLSIREQKLLRLMGVEF